MRILIIDNYDSFTYNLFQQVARIKKCIPEIFKNDEITYDEIVRKGFNCIIISPGPGRPNVQKDFGVCKEILSFAKQPVLGVCLGHQGIGWNEGCKIVHAPEPYHGRLSPIFHDNLGIFKGLPQGFNVVRYHSLIISSCLPKNLIITAWTEDGLIMGIEHATKPYWGIQFHPESICTQYGDEVIETFLNLAEKFNKNVTKHLK